MSVNILGIKLGYLNKKNTEFHQCLIASPEGLAVERDQGFPPKKCHHVTMLVHPLGFRTIKKELIVLAMDHLQLLVILLGSPCLDMCDFDCNSIYH